MKIETLIEVISAMHLSHYISNSSFPERGGIMFVAPPGSFKTAITQTLENYSNALVISDLTVKQAARLREDISGERIITLAFTDLEKLYQRQSSVSANIEGVLKAFVAEGFRRANWEDQRMQVIPARCTIIAGMTRMFYEEHFPHWLDDGFARRFLWAQFQLDDPGQIIDAIVRWQRIELSDNGFSNKIPTTKNIPFLANEDESRKLLAMLNFQPGREIGLASMKKMLSALKWKFPKSNKPMEILSDFAEALHREGARLHLHERKTNSSFSRNTRRIRRTVGNHSHKMRTNGKANARQDIPQGTRERELPTVPSNDISTGTKTGN